MEPIILEFGRTLLIFLIIITIWSLPWKAVALWKAAKKNHLVWFIIFLVVNTAGILEILYFFIFSKMKYEKKKKK